MNLSTLEDEFLLGKSTTLVEDAIENSVKDLEDEQQPQQYDAST